MEPHLDELNHRITDMDFPECHEPTFLQRRNELLCRALRSDEIFYGSSRELVDFKNLHPTDTIQTNCTSTSRENPFDFVQSIDAFLSEGSDSRNQILSSLLKRHSKFKDIINEHHFFTLTTLELYSSGKQPNMEDFRTAGRPILPVMIRAHDSIKTALLKVYSPEDTEVALKTVYLSKFLSKKYMTKVFAFTVDREHNIYTIQEFNRNADLSILMNRLAKFQMDILLKEKCELIVQLTKTISSLSKKNNRNFGVVHCDIKPENLLVAPDLKIKLCDFDEAQLLPYQNSCFRKISAVTWLYAPPELVKNYNMELEVLDYNSDTEYSCKWDSWSMGLLIFIIATSNHPYDDFIVNKLHNIEAGQAELAHLVLSSITEGEFFESLIRSSSGLLNSDDVYSRFLRRLLTGPTLSLLKFNPSQRSSIQTFRKEIKELIYTNLSPIKLM